MRFFYLHGYHKALRIHVLRQRWVLWTESAVFSAALANRKDTFVRTDRQFASFSSAAQMTSGNIAVAAAVTEG